MTAHLARIDIFPIKSMDGVAVSQTTILASGAMQSDRTYALMDSQNRFVNGKGNGTIHALRSTFSPDLLSVTCWCEDTTTRETFHLQHQRSALEAWLSNYFQQPITVAENADMGFPDDTQAAGPTVISTATLKTVASWFPNLSLEEIRRRFRTNLEIDGVPAFWEDQLFSSTNQPVKFAIGEVVLDGINPCQRCIVPTRNSYTGEATRDFQKMFCQQRAATLPPWTHPHRFNHFYRLGVNTNITSQGCKTLAVGDAVTVLMS